MPRLYENRVIGPPGTGKTSTLARYVRETVEKYGSDAVMVASFTKAAAAEIAGRDLPVAPNQVGTLHHFAYAALDHPDVAETKIPDWNERQEAAGRPHFKLTPSKRDLDDMDEDLGTEAEGDELYNRLEIYRARMVDRRTWDSEVLSFANAWEAWKREARVIDFTDMIEMALLATDEAPGSPQVGFMDECLAGDSLITLADGSRLPIRNIVNERLPVRVLSYNPALDTVEPKRVLGWRRVPRRQRTFVYVGSLVATYDHPVYTRESAYIQVGAILPWQHVLYLDHEKVRSCGPPDEGAVFPRARVSSWRCVAEFEPRAQSECSGAIRPECRAVGLSLVEIPGSKRMGAPAPQQASEDKFRRTDVLLRDAQPSGVYGASSFALPRGQAETADRKHSGYVGRSWPSCLVHGRWQFRSFHCTSPYICFSGTRYGRGGSLVQGAGLCLYPAKHYSRSLYSLHEPWGADVIPPYQALRSATLLLQDSTDSQGSAIPQTRRANRASSPLCSLRSVLQSSVYRSNMQCSMPQGQALGPGPRFAWETKTGAARGDAGCSYALCCLWTTFPALCNQPSANVQSPVSGAVDLETAEAGRAARQRVCCLWQAFPNRQIQKAPENMQPSLQGLADNWCRSTSARGASLCGLQSGVHNQPKESAPSATDHLQFQLSGKADRAEQTTEEDVYCLIVEDNHNFFADGILVRNCQDFTPLEMALVRKWGTQMDTLFVVGDPQQCIYTFSGASPEAFRNPPVPKSQQKVLDQSYRLPRQVHALAQRWIAQESTPFEYRPRDYEGEVRFEDSLSFRFPESLLVDAAKYLELGKTVMFLTTCGYMLDNLRHLLLEQGIPFHNPYRSRQPAWNPLHPGRGVASKDRLLAYLRPDPSASDRPQRWSPDDLKLWTAALRAEGTLRRGAKTALEGSGGGGECSDDFLEELFEAQSLARALDLDLDWLEQNLLASRRKGMEFPLRVARRWGARKLRDTPQTIVGTIHSTKGGEADVVYLCPDIAVPAMEQWEAGGEGRNAIVRQFYVGLSRARESLIICGPSSNLAVEIG